jgi:hypothetical protein
MKVAAKKREQFGVASDGEAARSPEVTDMPEEKGADQGKGWRTKKAA